MSSSSSTLVTPTKAVTNERSPVKTTFDNERELANGLVKLMRDLETIKEANASIILTLQDCTDGKEVKHRLEELQISGVEAVEQLRLECSQLLLLTGKKTVTEYVVARDASTEKHEMREAQLIANAENCSIQTPTPMDEAKKIAKRFKFATVDNEAHITSTTSPHSFTPVEKETLVPTMTSPFTDNATSPREYVENATSPRVSPRVQVISNPKQLNAGDVVYPMAIIDEKEVTVYLNFEQCFVLPLPKVHSRIYTFREAVQMKELRHYDKKGLNELLRAMKVLHMFGVGKTCFRKHLRAYLKTKILPPDDDKFTVKRGRSPFIASDRICDIVNAKVKANKSLVTNGDDDANNALNQEKLRKMVAEGLGVPENQSNSKRTIANYHAYAVAKDADVSETNMKVARKKSMAREIASRSERNCATHLAVTCATQFRVGRWENKPTDLSPGAEILYKAALEAFGRDVRPIDRRYLCNLDDAGEFVFAGTDDNSRKNSVGRQNSKC